MSKEITTNSNFVKTNSSKLKGYTKLKRIRTEEKQNVTLALGLIEETRMYSVAETKAAVSNKFCKYKSLEKEQILTLLSLSKPASVLLEIIKAEAVEKSYFKSLGLSISDPAIKNCNLLILSYSNYLEYFKLFIGDNDTIKPLARNKFSIALKELVNADILWVNTDTKTPKSFYYYNINYFVVGSEEAILIDYYTKTGKELPSILLNHGAIEKKLTKAIGNLVDDLPDDE